MSEVYSQSAYFLPSGYGDNRITLLTRDPHWLYAYWEVSNNRKNAFVEDFGPELWEKSIPVLKVTNLSKNESFFVRINDFSNNWYINVSDSNCLYVAEIGRKISDRFFITLATSNYTVTPGDNISNNTSAYFINYKDLKSGRLDLNTGKIYESYNINLQVSGMVWPSSPEFFGMSLEESMFGVSSAELYGVNLFEQLGISSDIFITKDDR